MRNNENGIVIYAEWSQNEYLHRFAYENQKNEIREDDHEKID